MALLRSFWSPKALPNGLSWTLWLAQQRPTGAPLVQAVLRAKRGNAARLDPTTLYANTLADRPCAVAGPQNGTVVRAHLSGGNLQSQSLPALPGSAWTTWSTVCAATLPSGGNTGVALAAAGATVSVAYLTSTTAVAVRDAADNGVTWGAAVAIATLVAPATSLALCYAPNGDLLLLAGDSGGTIHAYRRAAGQSAWVTELSLIPPAASAINSLALAYQGDWLALVAWTSGATNYLGSALYGTGALQAANTWSSVTDPLALQSGPALLVSGFAWGQDGGHAVLVEQWSGTLATNQAYHLICTSPQNFAAGRWTEPEPFPYSFASGVSIAQSVAAPAQYLAAAENLVATLTQPADLDLSARVISIRQVGEHHRGDTELVIDNADGSLTSLALTRDVLGKRLDLALGYQTVQGSEFIPQPQRWVTGVVSSWRQGRALLTLTAQDGWQLLARWEARRQYAFGAGALPALSVDTLIAWLLMRAGIEYTSPGASTLRSRTPQFHLPPGQVADAAMTELLDTIEGWLLFTATGATVIPLSATDPSLLTYAQSAQPLFQLFHQQELQPANLISVSTGSHGQTPSAQGVDASDAHLLGLAPHEHVDTQLEAANAAATAAALLRKTQLSAPTHALIALPNLAARLGDVLSFTDPLTGAQFTARIRSAALDLDRDSGRWEHQLGLSVV